MLEELRGIVHLLQPDSAREDARRLIVDEDVLHHDSITARTWVYKKLGMRYFPRTAPALAARFIRSAQAESDPSQFALLAYSMIAWNDGLVFMLGKEWLVQRLRVAEYAAETQDILDELDWLAANRAPSIEGWSGVTRQSAAAHYLSLLRDSGFATGSLRKQLRSPYVSPGVVLFGTQLILGSGGSPESVPEHELFGIMGLGPADVIDALTDLHAEGRVTFRIQGNVAHIDLHEREEGAA
jgi:hypothetical protein